MFELNDSNLKKVTRVKIVGLGNGGGSALNRVIKREVHGTEFIAINTDAQALLTSLAPKRIQIGEKLTHGLGANSNTEIGEMSAKDEQDDIIEAFDQADMVIVVAGLGGGTGSGAAPVVASYAKNDIGALTISIVTIPFSFEGTQRIQRAEASLAKLKECSDAVIVIYNDRLLAMESQNKENNQTIAFETVDDMIARAIQGVVNLIVQPGLVNLDLDDVSLILKNSGMAVIGLGIGTGENASIEAVEDAAEFPLFDEKIKCAKSILVNITGSDENLSMFELTEAVEAIHKMSASNANIIWGATVDNTLGDRVTAIVIASGFDNSKGFESSLQERKLGDFEREMYKQVVDECVKRIHSPATTVAECVELMRELRITLKEMRDGNNGIDEW